MAQRATKDLEKDQQGTSRFAILEETDSLTIINTYIINYMGGTHSLYASGGGGERDNILKIFSLKIMKHALGRVWTLILIRKYFDREYWGIPYSGTKSD